MRFICYANQNDRKIVTRRPKRRQYQRERGIAMERFQNTTEIHAPAGVCYERWHHFEKFPHFMTNVKDVQRMSDKQWHWVVSGPLGNAIEWDAVIDIDEPKRLVAWHSVSGSELKIQSAVQFASLNADCTAVTCEIQYESPAGGLMEALMHVMKNPQKMLEEEMRNFKHLVEGTNIPTEKVHTGKVLQPDEFVVGHQATEVKTSSGASQRDASIVLPVVPPERDVSLPENAVVLDESILDDDEYETLFGLEDDLPQVGTSAPLPSEDIEAFQILEEEENPYLASEGAIYSEDLIDMRADRLGLDDNDVFSQSMDVETEDLESFTEDLDTEIDAGLGPRDIPSSEEPTAGQSEDRAGERGSPRST